jgi:hypothetical protein
MAFGKCGGGGRRSAAREAAPLIAVWTTVTETHSATLIDLSSSGARLHCGVVPRIDEELQVTIEGIRAFGRVMWCYKEQFGVAFDSPFDAADVELLRKRVASSFGFTAEMKAALDEWTIGAAR